MSPARLLDESSIRSISTLERDAKEMELYRRCRYECGIKLKTEAGDEDELTDAPAVNIYISYS